MAAVYKALSRPEDAENGTEVNGEQKEKKIKQKVLILSSRGVTHRQRHLINDLHSLLPHSRKESKLDTKTKLYQLNELADLYSCNNILFFEARKGKDLYLWLSKPPNGPTIKMHLQNLHTMEELHFTGNCLKGSRPILSFDEAFNDDSKPHLQVLKELLSQSFGVPKGSRKTKPFIDHVMSFTLAEGRVWIRCYQINESEQPKFQPNGAYTNGDHASSDSETNESRRTTKSSRKDNETNVSLVEIGPRLVLTPIVILESSFGGPVIFENKEFVSPNQVRSDLRKAKAGQWSRRAEARVERKVKKGDMGLMTEGGRKVERDALDDRVLFA
ncbi:MAG: Ribosome biogenesis protein brx1 [Bogoriella megaspora]|nr:MAG: Ribosome biogenesis protein brx1 [Bogoriella megaspora]